MRAAVLWYGPSRLASRLVQRNEGRSVQRSVSKHNTLMEGLLKGKGGNSTGFTTPVESMEKQMVKRIRSTEAAFFFSDDNYKLRKMAGLDTSSAHMLELERQSLEDDVIATRRAKWEEMISQEFKEFEGEHIPISLTNRIAVIKNKARTLLETTTLHGLDGSDLSTGVDEELLKADRSMIIGIKNLELGPSSGVGKRRLTEKTIQEWGDKMGNPDIARTVGGMLLASVFYVTVQVVVDDKHRALARKELPWLFNALEGTRTPV